MLPDDHQEAWLPFHTPSGRPIIRVARRPENNSEAAMLVARGKVVYPTCPPPPRTSGRPSIVLVPFIDLPPIRPAEASARSTHTAARVCSPVPSALSAGRHRRPRHPGSGTRASTAQSARRRAERRGCRSPTWASRPTGGCGSRTRSSGRRGPAPGRRQHCARGPRRSRPQPGARLQHLIELNRRAAHATRS
jgi:hypothetical protein